jgi:Fic family protein
MKLRAGLAHLWFVTVHPFDDGNGRVARAIADWQLARSENSAQRFYSMSAQIRQERNDYYDILEHTQKGTLDVTPWLDWFLGCLGHALTSMIAGASYSTACSMALSASSPRRNGRRSQSARTIRRCATSRA